MPVILQCPDKSVLDALAGRIRFGIEKKGVHLLFPDELAILWNYHGIKSDRERILTVRNFAVVYGFEVLMSSSSNMALFKKSN
jgi:hypothetical protein